MIKRSSSPLPDLENSKTEIEKDNMLEFLKDEIENEDKAAKSRGDSETSLQN